ncbi:MAG: 4'-phosphopantetheinyl transferase superfamily protein [Lachnospiraceae bacterium]|nr:4'-phosphopantetheinyl transferase superfamily protein [Lachnospiraceae bacterium]
MKLPPDLREESLPDLRRLLSPDRIEKTGKLRGKKDRLRSYFAELLLLYGLCSEGILKNTPLVFGYSSFKKPYLPEYPGVFFNLSHSGDYVALALSSFEVGIDIEHMREHTDRIAQRFYSPEENEYLSSLPEKERKREFIRLWTMKESYLKALGEGLGIPLCDIAFPEGGRKGPVFRGKPDPERRLFTFSPEEGYEAAVCMSAGEAPFDEGSIRFLQAGEVLEKWGFSPNPS